MTSPRITPSAFALPLLIGATLGTAAQADLVQAFYGSSSAYAYKILHMPDMDQRRTTLPSDGSMYCVPTATFNVFAYAANHGFPNAPPEDGDWQLQSKYVETSLWLVLLGDWMNTDPATGTKGNGTKAGMDAMLAMAPYLKRVHKALSSSYSPSAAKLALYGCQGWAMNLTYGKWAEVDEVGGIPVVERVGGHAVTLTRLYRSGGEWILRYRDPADDSASLTTQSTFKNTTRTPYNYVAYFGGLSVYNLKSLNAIFATSGGTRVIDCLFGIRPLFGLSFSNTGDTAGGGTVQILDPLAFEGSAAAQFPSISISPFLDVLDFGFDADFQNALVIAKSNVFVAPARLRTLDLLTGQLTTLTPSPSNVERFATDRLNHIYAFDSAGTLFKLAEDGTPIVDTTAIPDPTDVAVHDGDDSIWVISVPERKVVKLFADFSETLLTLNVPTPVPMSGDARLAIHPITGNAWFMSDANDTLYGLYQPPAGGVGVHAFSSPALAGADSFSFGDDGELFVSGDGSVKVLKALSDSSWAVDDAHPFHGLPGGSHLAMLRNSDNYDPIEHDGPEWRNLTQAELEENGPFVGDCNPDLNGDDVVDGADVGLLLAAWGQGVDGPADIDQDGDVDGADLGLLLSAWGPCV
jgi:hypothetical protein